MINKIKSMFGAQDMTVGSPAAALLKFSIPLLIGNFAQLLYGTVDSIIVGKYIGDAALAALGTSMPIQHMFFVFFMTIGNGVTILVSQYFGAKDYKKLSYGIGSSFSMIAVATLIIMLIAAPLSGSVLKLTNTPPEAFDMAKNYLFIILVGCLGTGFYNIISGVLRGLGESLFPLLVLLCTTLANVFLDILFIATFKMGVEGAAYATIICQVFSATACLIKVIRMKGIVNIDRESIKPRKEMVVQILRLGVPVGISQGIMSLSFVFVQSLINSMGILVTTSTTAVMRVDGFAVLPNMAFSMAASTFTGQNIGANNMERVKRGGKIVVIMGFVTAVALVTAIMIFGKNMLTLFTETDQVVELGARMLRIMSFGYLGISFMQSYGGIMRGAGDTMAAMWITIITNVLLRVPIAYTLAAITKSADYPAGHPDAIYLSMMISWVIGAILTVLYYRTGKWKNKAVIRSGEFPVQTEV